MKTLHYYYYILIAFSLMLQVSWGSGKPGGQIKVDPQALPICSIGKENPYDENSNKYAIFEPEEIKGYTAEGQFTAVVLEYPEPDAGYELTREEYKWTVTENLKIKNADQKTCTVDSSTKQQWGKEIRVTCKMSFYESKDGQEKHLTDLEASHKVLTPLVVVHQISFNHIHGNHNADAMDLKQNYEDKEIISCPEATFDDEGNTIKSEPFLYLGGKKPSPKIKVEVKPGVIEKAKIKTKSEIKVPENFLPELDEQEFDNNKEFEISFQDNIDAKLNEGSQIWTWRLTEIQGTPLAKQTIAFKTTVKDGYVLFAEPLKSPWDMNDHKKKPWVDALHLAIAKAGNRGFDKNSSSTIIGNITNYTFNNMGWKYDTTNGAASYTYLTPVVALIDLNGYLENKKKIVNCYDQCFSLSAFARLLGIDANGYLHFPFGDETIPDHTGIEPRSGQLLPVYIIGVKKDKELTKCNNPFYDLKYSSGIVLCDEVKGEIYVNKNPTENSGKKKLHEHYKCRLGFGNHAYVQFNGNVYDACAGPVVGVPLETYKLETVEYPLYKKPQLVETEFN